MRNPWWQDSTQTAPPPGSLAVEPRDDNCWEFVYPRLTMTIYDVFEEAIDAWRAGEMDYAEDRYRQLLEDYPEFIDAYHHLAILLEETGQEAEAYALWQHAVQLGLDQLPEPVLIGSGSLPWAMIDNRPFLRAFHGLALEIAERGEVDKALQAYLMLLGWNPDDNQGIRVLAIDCYFQLEQPEGALEICDLFAEDGMPEVLYGRALALYQLGELDRARQAMTFAIVNLPLVADELIKPSHRKPKGMREDRVALWTPEQAYLYWKEQGGYWKKTPGALDLLREVVGELLTSER